MKHFFLITNAGKDPDFTYAKSLASKIKALGGEVAFLEKDGLESGYREALLKGIPEETEAILVIGGDGTLIKAARDTLEKDLPLIGINLGKLGYLCEVDENNIDTALKRLIEDSYQVEDRMMLHAAIYRDGQEIKSDTALNDVVIHRSGALNVIGLEAYVNGQFLSSYVGDGLIVSTPTGSTGYNLSSGGPIIEPQAEMILLTPINSHDLNHSSIVFDQNTVISVKMRGGNYNSEATINVSYDGWKTVRLESGDEIVVKRSEKKTRILRLSNRSFLETLEKKMQRYT